jgi:ABC-type enterobactin transport system permease subunit
MEPMKLNAGGLLGALLGGGVTGSILYAQVAALNQLQRSDVRIILVGLVIGAIIGNLLWAWVSSKLIRPRDSNEQ